MCAISPADVESNLKDFRAGLPMNLLRKHLSHSSVVGQSCRVRLLARRGSRWMAKTKLWTMPYVPIIIPGWRRVLRGEVLLRLGDWGVGSAGCATTPMVRMSTGDHGPSWACATRPSRSVATPKYQSARHQSAQAAFSIRLPDMITVPWFKLPSSHRPWNTSSRSSAG